MFQKLNFPDPPVTNQQSLSLKPPIDMFRKKSLNLQLMLSLMNIIYRLNFLYGSHFTTRKHFPLHDHHMRMHLKISRVTVEGQLKYHHRASIFFSHVRDKNNSEKF